MAGLLGIFLAAMMAGLNNRVGALALADVRGALGFGLDDASWLSTAYTAGELIAMPFAAWFAITLSVRRFHLWMVGTCTVLAVLLPFVQDLNLLLGLRFVQGISSGTLIPILMMAALKFLPPNIRLHGLALYAMTATFAPNLAIWLAGQWTDGFFDWRWVYWQIVPVAAGRRLLVGWGLPRERSRRRASGRPTGSAWPSAYRPSGLISDRARPGRAPGLVQLAIDHGGVAGRVGPAVRLPADRVVSPIAVPQAADPRAPQSGTGLHPFRLPAGGSAVRLAAACQLPRADPELPLDADGTRSA